MGNDRPRQRAGDRAVDDLGHRRLAHLTEILADPVGDHDRFVHRVAKHGQHRCQHGKREFPLEYREEAENDHHVVEVSDDRGHREAPFEAQRQIGDDADADQKKGQRAVLVELLADLRSDEFDALLGDARVVRLERRHDPLG